MIKQKMDNVKATLRVAERLLNEAVNSTDNTEEQIEIMAVLKRVREGIQEVSSAFPKEKFNVTAWLQIKTSNDTDHNDRVQKILDDAVATGAYDDKEWLANVTVENLAKLGKLGECDHVCKDCDQRHVVGNEEYCLQGEEMK